MMDDLYENVIQSMDDMPVVKLMRKIQHGIENIHRYEKKNYLVDSYIFDESDAERMKEDIIRTIQLGVDIPPAPNIDDAPPAEPPPTASQDDTFDGQNWQFTNGKWQPPEACIHKTSTTSNTKSAMQSDSGANRIVTDDITLLQNVIHIEPTPMSGCNKDDPAAIVCTAMGQLPITTTNGDTIPVTCYYSAQVDGTIISPTTIVAQHQDAFYGYMQYSDYSNKNGYLIFLGHNGNENQYMPIECTNDLWYHCHHSLGSAGTPTINRLSNAARYELWHQRTGHAGITILETLHKHAEGVPQLKGNAFYRCPSCMSGKLATKRSIGGKSARRTNANAPTKEPPPAPDDDDTYMPDAQPGQHFHMDFGFVRGSDFNYKDNTGKTVTSIDGKNAYLAIIDRSSRYMWIFLTSSKKPPIKEARMILNKFKSTNPHRTVRVDQGGELNSQAFKEMIAEEQFSLELTGSDSSAQNGMVENPNRTYGQMMRCLLHSSELGPEYWSYALLHAVYIKNRITHRSISTTPFQKFTGIKPDLSNLKIFGSRVYSKKPGKRPYKLDHHTASGYFLGYTATDKVVNYIDEKTGRVKTASHVIFDEAHMTTHASKAPLAAQTLQRLGYYAKEDWIEEVNTEEIQEEKRSQFLVQCLTASAKVPQRSTSGSVGYDLHFDSTTSTTIEPGEFKIMSTGIAITCPQNTYARIAPRSGLTVKNSLTTLAGVIDPDYTGEVKVILHNFGTVQQVVEPQTKIAQIILENVVTPTATIVESLSNTMRGDNGFGSTNTTHPETSKEKNNNTPTFQLQQTNIDADLQQRTTAAAATLKADLHTTFQPTSHLELSYDPYDNHTHRTIDIRKHEKDPMLGLVIEICPDRNLPILKDCKKGSSAMKIPRWRSQLRNGYITHINNISVTTIEQIRQQIKTALDNNEPTIDIGFATISKQAMHPQLGIPQLYHDQMNIIGKHLWEIRNSDEWNKDVQDEILFPLDDEKFANIARLAPKKLGKDKLWSMYHNLPDWYKIGSIKKRKKLTRRWLLKQDDWGDWEASEHKQLDQYEAQGTIGYPEPIPPNVNVLPLLWTYMIKDCGTKKARCVCNGSPKMKGSVTLGNTYAGSLEQTGSRIFWATTAINNYITIGADVSNAFAEAPAPKAPLYVTIDQPYREWYRKKFPDKPEIPEGYGLPVRGALQGHPESARLWAILIDDILRKLNLQPCSHEPCLYYSNNFNNTGKTVLFLRQVDDFAVSCQDKETALEVIKIIDEMMTVPVKHLGTIKRFNGVDVLQTKHFIKLYNKTYIDKILVRHDWIHQEPQHQHNLPLPMRNDPAYQRKLEQEPTPTQDEIHKLEKEMGFGYRQAIGELIYALVTCRPDISYPVIKLSQYSTRPTRLHFEAVKDIYRYLNATKEDGIYYWRKTPRDDLPYHPPPILNNDNNYEETEIHERQQTQHNVMFGAVDSDYAGDTSHRRSVSGIILRIAGGTVLYKTKFQDTIALSSTEAEFTAAVEAGKYILYVRSILDEIGVPQELATVLYEDNQGALLMANAQQPTKRTRHMDIKNFVLQDWVKRDLLELARISTHDNYADVMTKATGRTLFYRHMNYVMGKIIPSYIQNTSILNSDTTNFKQANGYVVDSTGG